MADSYGCLLDSADIIATLDSLPARFYIKDSEGRFVYMNPACAHGMGLSSASDGLGSSDADFFEESRARTWLEEERQLVNGARSAIRDREECEVRKDGTQRWVLTTKVPIYGKTGTVIGVFGVSSDISAQKHELECYTHAIAGARDGLWYRDLDTNRVWFSDRWKEMLGYTPREFPDELDQLLQHVAPDDIDRVTTAINDHLSGRSDQYTCEFRLRKKDGTFCWVLAKGKATRDESGYRFAGSHTEITESKKNEKFYHTVLDAINSLIFVKDSELRFTFVNSATSLAFGLSRDRLIGLRDRDINECIQEVARFERDDRHVLETEQQLVIPHERLTFADGATHDLATVKIPLRLGPSDKVHVLGVATDITELCKQSELTAKLLNVLLEAIEQIEAAPTEDDACLQALLQLAELDYPECMISFLQRENDQHFVIADVRYASSEKWRKIALRTRRLYDTESHSLDVLSAVLKERRSRFVRDSRTDAHCDRVLSREVGLISQYVAPLCTSSTPIGTLQIDMGDTLAPPKETCRMFDALAAHLSLAIDRHRTRDSLETLTTQLLSIAKLMAFESASIGIAHILNHSMTDYLLKLDAATRNPEIRCNKAAIGFLDVTKTFVKGWYESARDNLRRFHQEQVKTDIPIDEVAKEVVEKWQKKAADRRCKLRGEFDAPSIVIKASRVALTEMLNVLIVNAIDASARTILVTTSVSGQSVDGLDTASSGVLVINVEDDGDGIPPDYQKQVFRAGWTSKGARGHGIGLATADLMAKDLGGRLDLVSPGRSGGARSTVFSIRLPVNVD